LQWLAEHTHGQANVGLVTLMATGASDTSWFLYNRNFNARFHLVAIYPGEGIPIYDYLIFPMNLKQRGMTIPAPWKDHLIHTISGGNTTYCYITARASPDVIERSHGK